MEAYSTLSRSASLSGLTSSIAWQVNRLAYDFSVIDVNQDYLLYFSLGNLVSARFLRWTPTHWDYHAPVADVHRPS